MRNDEIVVYSHLCKVMNFSLELKLPKQSRFQCLYGFCYIFFNFYCDFGEFFFKISLTNVRNLPIEI